MAKESIKGLLTLARSGCGFINTEKYEYFVSRKLLKDKYFFIGDELEIISYNKGNKGYEVEDFKLVKRHKFKGDGIIDHFTKDKI